MEAAFTNTIVSGLLELLALAAIVGMTAVVTYLSYWWALHYGLISLNQHGKLTLKPKHLPPGSMGLPMIGQTFVWRKNQAEFYDSRWRRHGEIYKTHLFGHPTVVATTQEAARKLLISNGNFLKGDAPGQLPTLLGPRAVIFEEGEMHNRLKKRFMKHLQPEALKSLVAAIEELALKHLSGWSNRSTINFVDEIQRYTLGVGMLVCLGPLPATAAKLSQEFEELEKGIKTAPINKPGYQFYDSLQAKSRFIKKLHDIINTRLAEQSSKRPKDILDSLTNNEDALPHSVIEDNVLVFLFASNKTTASLTSFTVKYLHDHPDVLQKVKDEQEKIRNRKAPEVPLSWEDLKDMSYTYQVLLESSRMANPVSMQYRKVEKEIEYKGYVIPQNWRLLTLHRQWHLDPKLFPDPYKFDPSRFETPQPALTTFGMGTHICAGYELARVELLIFLHHFTTTFRWEIIKDGPTQDSIFPYPYARLPLRLTQL